MLLAIPSPGTKSLASTNIASLELGTGALRKDLIPTNTLGSAATGIDVTVSRVVHSRICFRSGEQIDWLAVEHTQVDDDDVDEVVDPEVELVSGDGAELGCAATAEAAATGGAAWAGAADGATEGVIDGAADGEAPAAL